MTVISHHYYIIIIYLYISLVDILQGSAAADTVRLNYVSILRSLSPAFDNFFYDHHLHRLDFHELCMWIATANYCLQQLPEKLTECAAARWLWSQNACVNRNDLHRDESFAPIKFVICVLRFCRRVWSRACLCSSAVARREIAVPVLPMQKFIIIRFFLNLFYIMIFGKDVNSLRCSIPLPTESD